MESASVDILVRRLEKESQTWANVSDLVQYIFAYKYQGRVIKWARGFNSQLNGRRQDSIPKVNDLPVGNRH